MALDRMFWIELRARRRIFASVAASWHSSLISNRGNTATARMPMQIIISSSVKPLARRRRCRESATEVLVLNGLHFLVTLEDPAQSRERVDLDRHPLLGLQILEMNGVRG